MLKLHFFFICLIGLLLSCGPTPPSEVEVRTRILGNYCEGWKYRLELTDSTYVNRSVEQGAFRHDVYLRCSGTYSLKLENDQWIIRFEKDDRPNTTHQFCEQEYVLWSKEEGYIGGENSIILRAPLDGKTLIKGPCDE